MKSNKLSLLFFTIVSVVVLGPLAANAACFTDNLTINDQAERLDERMQNLAHQTGCALETNDAFMQIEANTAPALSGSMTALGAYTQSLRGTGFAVTQVNDESGTHFKIVANPTSSPTTTTASAAAKNNQLLLLLAALAIIALAAAAKIFVFKKKTTPGNKLR